MLYVSCEVFEQWAGNLSVRTPVLGATVMTAWGLDLVCAGCVGVGMGAWATKMMEGMNFGLIGFLILLDSQRLP